MSSLASAAMALTMIAAFLLALGGVRMMRKERGRGTLMLAAAAVLVGNVLIWTL